MNIFKLFYYTCKFFNFLHLVKCTLNLNSSSKQTAWEHDELILVFSGINQFSAPLLVGKSLSIDMEIREKVS